MRNEFFRAAFGVRTRLRVVFNCNQPLRGMPLQASHGRAAVLFLVEKNDSARIEAVIATDYLYLSGINFGLENRRG